MSTEIDPTKLSLGDKVLLICKEHEYNPGADIPSMFVGMMGEYYFFACRSGVVLGLKPHDDGTLRDDHMRIITLEKPGESETTETPTE